MVIGDMSDTERVLVGLDLLPKLHPLGVSIGARNNEKERQKERHGFHFTPFTVLAVGVLEAWVGV